MNQIKKKKWLLLLLVGLYITGLIFAEKDEKKRGKEEAKDKDILKYHIVVTATKTEQPRVELSSSTSVITSERLKETGKITVFEAINSMYGLNVIQAGGAGEVSSLFIRGGKSEHSLVLIDGIEMNDPISPGRSFNFAHLTVDNIERIEIVRGPQSTLYGSVRQYRFSKNYSLFF